MVEGVSKALWIVVASVFAVAASLAPVSRGQQAPCFFVFGDSVFDNGNNNDNSILGQDGRVNYLPYGIDFPNGPTGRFSNGRTIPDFIAELAGVNDTIPPNPSVSRPSRLPRAQYNIGVNYASGGGGLLPFGNPLTIYEISLQLQTMFFATDILKAGVPISRRNQCLYIISSGSTDYINYFMRRPREDPYTFRRSLMQFYRNSLSQLREVGAKNVALFGIGKLGCTPQMVARHGGGVGCAEKVNKAVDIFNNRLKALVARLNKNTSGEKYTYVDLFSRNAEYFAAHGVTVGNKSCCQVESSVGNNGHCAVNGTVCPDRTKYFYWDNLHTTETINEKVATAAFNGDIASPYSISQLVN